MTSIPSSARQVAGFIDAILITTIMATSGCASSFRERDQERQRLEQAIRAVSAPEVEVRYFSAYIDLNGDGRNETIVFLRGPQVCGSGGCPTLVFSPGAAGEDYRLVSFTQLTRPPIVAARTKTNGWRDLIVFVAGGGILEGYDVLLPFDGSSYPESPFLDPARRLEGRADGDLLIERRSSADGRPLRPTPGSDWSRVEYWMVSHPRSGALLPRLVRFRDPALQKTVNWQLDSLASSLACEKGSDPARSSYESKSEVTYAGDDVLSVSVHAAYYCGGTHPTAANFSITFDLRTGAVVPFEALFSDYQRDGPEIVLSLFPARVARAEHRAGAGNTESTEDCEDALIFSIAHLLEAGFSYVLSDRGLVVQPNFPHVIHACAEEVVVPFDRVRRFAAPDGLLARVAAAPTP